MKIISILTALFFCTIAFGQQQRFDIPFETECTFSGTKTTQIKTYKSERVTYPLLENKWWTTISDTSSFSVDDILVTDLFIRAFDYKSEGSKSILQITVVINGISQTLIVSGKDPNKTEILEIWGKTGKLLETSCLLK